MAEKARTISTQVSAEEAAHYLGLAQSQGISISAFMRSALAQVYPLPTVAPQPHRPESPPVVEVATPPARPLPVMIGEDALDLEDELSAQLQGIVRNQGDAPRAEDPRYAVPVAVANDEHPCGHLHPNPPPNLTRADCQGSCRAQGGKPCHWPAQAARQCGSFRARR